MRQSFDGINFDFEKTVAFTANIPLNFHEKVKGKFFFVVIENDSGQNQSFLRAKTFIKDEARSFHLENSSVVVENEHLSNLTFDGDGNLIVRVDQPSIFDVNVTNASLAVTNAALSSLSFSGSRLLTSNAPLSSSTDSVLVYGSDDAGTTRRVLKTSSNGTLEVSGSVIATQVAVSCTKFLNITNAATVLSYGLVHLYGFYAFNSGSQSAFLRFYDTTTSANLANQNSKMMFHIPPFTGITINYQNYIIFANSFRLRASSIIGPISGSSYLTDYDDTPLETSIQVHINYIG